MNNKLVPSVRVVVAMSGGVDSSLAAFLLKEKGYDVIGITLKLWDYSEVGGDLYKDGRCCSLESMNDARNICQKIGAPHYVLDFREQFKKKVISDFVNEYKKGRTPNPCIVCNTDIKWKLLWNKAKELGADYLATGHYARINYSDENGRYLLLKGADSTKDQSYALWGLSQEYLSRTLFSLGELTKKEVRDLAIKHGLKTAQKEESQEICFVPDDDYERFLREWDDRDSEKSLNQIKTGPIYDLKKEKLGEHRGIPFYTVGQRKGLKIALGKPLYVVKIDPEENAIYVGENKDLFRTSFIVSDVNWISIPELKEKMECSVKIRYMHNPAKVTISPYSGQIFGANKLVEFDLEADARKSKLLHSTSSCTPERVLVKFEKPERAITPGQSAVFYEGEKVIGGGVIESVMS
ncbi:MAG TPA: tRNA 2-thiouridine(34) synthase MnmA [Terriglobales bacterium]|nr:tRNA 2-thiouridine(34) synthase MnmA [Terriglobales bacterium]